MEIATWNVLLQNDEYSTHWGNPLSIASCRNRTACVHDRWNRIWSRLSDGLPTKSGTADLVLLQEAEDEFLSLNPPGWELLERSGDCAIIGRQHIDPVETYLLDAPGLSGCPSVPVVVVTLGEDRGGGRELHVGSVHLKVSTDLNDWFDGITPREDANHSLILGGDFNQNLTDFQERGGWSVAPPLAAENKILGTSQKEHNWMGNFDGFFARHSSSSKIQSTEPSVLLQGFMPKVLEGYPQGKIVQEVGQFIWDNSSLLFSPTSMFENDTVAVPFSHPLEEALSDHLLVTTTFFWDATQVFSDTN